MKRLFTLTIVGFFCFFSHAQVIEVNGFKDLGTLNQLNEHKAIISNGKVVINTKDIKGTPYWSEDFVAGKIISNKDNSSLQAFIRYRIFDDVFEVKKEKNDNEIMVMKRSSTFDILLNNKRFTLLTDLPVKINGAYNGYGMTMVQPTSGEGVSLYKRMSKEYHPEVPAKGPYDRAEKAELESIDFYFVGINGQLHQIIPDRREAYKAFPDKNDLLKNYIKKERLRFRNDEIDQDLTTLVNYYNSLQ